MIPAFLDVYLSGNERLVYSLGFDIEEKVNDGVRDLLFLYEVGVGKEVLFEARFLAGLQVFGIGNDLAGCDPEMTSI